MSKSATLSRQVGFALGGILVAILSIVLAYYAHGHEAPSGWSYPMECCSNLDCGVVEDHSFLKSDNPNETPVMVVTVKGHDGKSRSAPVPRDFTPRQSPDNLMHACVSLGTPARLICLFVPPTG